MYEMCAIGDVPNLFRTDCFSDSLARSQTHSVVICDVSNATFFFPQSDDGRQGTISPDSG